mmetsp:Transcript_38314/g.108333  ORF Transcript_38314/g.108333 Transcript_38314/m.108333 type:complete len:151 (+) Transcript_38314:2603-3055(+)
MAEATNYCYPQRWQTATAGSEALGDSVLLQFGMFLNFQWVWWGVLVVVGYALLFAANTALTYSFRQAPGRLAAMGGKGLDTEKENVLKALMGQEKKEEELAFTPMTLVFKRLSYFVPKPGGAKGVRSAGSASLCKEYSLRAPWPVMCNCR